MEKQKVSTDKIRVAVFENFFNEFNFETFLDFTKKPLPLDPEILKILFKTDNPNASNDDKKSELLNDYGLSQRKFQRDFLPSLVAFCDEGNWLKIKPKLLEYIYSDNSDSNLLYLNNIIAFLYRTTKKYHLNSLDRIQEILEPFLKKADLPSSIYFDWIKANYTLKAENSNVNSEFIAENLVVIKKLEEHEKGLAKKIYSSCGVINFRRYSPEILIDMSNNFEANSPYILCATANEDHSGVNSNMTHQISNDINSNLKENGKKTRLLVTDASSILDILKIIKSQKFPPTTVIISAHGNEDGFYLDKNIYGDIDTESLNNRTIFLINELVKNNVKVIFVACSVGKKYGFQDNLEKLFPNIKIVAPYGNILADVKIEMDSEDEITKVSYFQIGGIGSHYSSNF
jgi:hypothetical protein